METKPSGDSLSIAKFIFSAFVIAIHAEFLADTNKAAYDYLVNGFFRLAVPFFFLASGYLLAPKASGVQQGKWVRRSLKVYCFWMIVYSPFFLINSEGSLISLGRILKLVAFGYWHLWYMPALILAASIVFLLQRYTDRFVCALAIILFIFGCALQYYAAFSGHRLSADSYRNGLFFGFPFLVIGTRFKFVYSLLKSYITYAALLIIGLFAFGAEVYFVNHTGFTISGFDLYFTAFPVSILLFGIFQRTRFIGILIPRQLPSGIYFSHLLVLMLLKIIVPGMGSVLLFSLTLALSTIASFGLIVASRRLSFIV